MRRGHGSTKVPNVKLRPVQAVRKTLQEETPEDSRLERMSMDDANEPGISRQEPFNTTKPFSKVILCCTGIKDQQSAVFKMATELGARCQQDLTNDTTHLIATEPGSVKYKVALEKGMTVMTPDWVIETYDAWLQGESIDLVERIDLFRLPFFMGLTISVTGDIDSNSRKEIHTLVAAYGGVYSSNLTKACSHLLVCGTTYDSVVSTDKVKFALRVNKENKANMHILWVEWFWDCVEWLGKFDENKYRIERARPGKVLRPVSRDTETEPNQRGTVRGVASAGQRTQPRPRPPPVAIDLAHDAPEPGAAPSRSETALAAQSAALWNEIRRANLPGTAATSGSQEKKRSINPVIQDDLPALQEIMHDSHAVTSSQKVSKDPSRRKPYVQSQVAKPSKSVLGRLALSRATSFEPSSKAASRLKSGPFAARSQDPDPASVIPQRKKGLFDGKKFCLIGEARCSVLEGAIQSSGGVLVPEDALEEEGGEDGTVHLDYLIVRLMSGSKYISTFGFAASPLLPVFLTECWVEQCLHEERICEPDEHISFRPVVVPTPVGGTEDMRIHISGLDDGELLYNQRLARTLGAQVAVVFSRKSTTHLMCPSPSGTKYDHAKEWGIPIIQPAWLHEMACTGIVPDTARFSITNSPIIADITNDDREAYPEPGRPPSQPPVYVFQATGPLVRSENMPEYAFGFPDSRIFTAASPGTHPGKLMSPHRPATSPAKLLSFQSPVKSLNNASNALSDLAALLGAKRKSEEPEEAVPVLKKRTRPVARVKTTETPNACTSITGERVPYQRFSSKGNLADGVDYGSLLVRGTSSTSPPVEESMRVTYEDPESKSERRKLLRLIEGHTDGEEGDMLDLADMKGKLTGQGKSSSKTVAPRRSTRQT